MKHVLKYALELHAPTVVREYTVTQNDSIEFVITLSQGGEPIDLTGVTPSLAVKRRDGVVTALPGTANGNTVTFALGSTETAKPGTVYAAVQLYGADGRVSSLPFSFQVKGDLTAAGTIPSENEATLIEVVLQDGPGIIQRAETAAATAEQVAAENKTRFLTPVATVAERDEKYASPTHGDTVQVTGEAAYYRYEDGAGWKKTNEYNPDAVDHLSQQLADKVGKAEFIRKADKSYVDSVAQSIASGSPKGVYETAAALQAAHPSGNSNIYVVKENGNWYYWDGVAWKSGGVYQSNADFDDLRLNVRTLEESLDGYTMRNLLRNSDFAETVNGWKSNNATQRWADGKLVATSTGASFSPSVDPTSDNRPSTAVGNKIYVSAVFKASEKPWRVRLLLSVPGAGSLQVAAVTPTPGEFQFVSGIIEIPATYTTGNVTPIITYEHTSLELSNGSVMEVDNFMYIDLTNDFGRGNEPTKSKVDGDISRLPGKVFDGSHRFILLNERLKSVEHKLTAVAPDTEYSNVFTNRATAGESGVYSTEGLRYALLDVARCTRGDITLLGRKEPTDAWREIPVKFSSEVYPRIHHQGQFVAVVSTVNEIKFALALRPEGVATLDFKLSNSELVQFAPPIIEASLKRPSPSHPDSQLYRNSNSGMAVCAAPYLPVGTMYGNSGAYIRKTTDGGQTWTNHAQLPGVIQRLWKTKKGNILAFLGNGETYSYDESAGTSTLVHTLETPGAAVSSTLGGMQVYENFVFIVEYGPNNAAENPRRAYMSQDYGMTWKKIFEGPKNETLTQKTWHTHAIHYDPYENVIWLVNGDGHQNANVRWSDNLGATWNKVYEDGYCPNQFTTIYALPHCVLFGTDNRNTGYWRYDRRANGIKSGPVEIKQALELYRNFMPYEPIATEGLVTYGDTPAVYFSYSILRDDGKNLLPTVTATADGRTFYTVYTAPEPSDFPSNTFIGLTVSGLTQDGNIIASWLHKPEGQTTQTNFIKIKEPRWVDL